MLIPARWPDDAARPLTKEGIARFRAAARGLRRLVPAVDSVLSSGYARAWQTAELLHEVAGWQEPEECPALEAGRPATAVLDSFRAATSTRSPSSGTSRTSPASRRSSAPGTRTGFSSS